MMTQDPPLSDNFADPAVLLAQCIDAFLPAEKVSTADYAARHRYLYNEGGGYVGLWNHEKAPYLVGIMDALDRVADGEVTPENTTVALVKPAQCGGTAVAENWLLHNVATDPANMLWYMQIKDTLEAYVKKVINPMVEQHPEMLSRRGTERTDDSLSFKRFLGMTVEFLPATENALKSKSAGRIVADEWDAYELPADPKTNLDSRRQTYGAESMLFALSHADKAKGEKEEDWETGIMALYRESDRRVWWWRCPHCDMFSSPNPGTRFHMPIGYDPEAPLDRIRETAHMVCPHNGCVISDAERAGMNLTGRWVGRGQSIDEETGEVTGTLQKSDIAGFWIVGAMSLFIRGGLGHLVYERVKAEREYAATGSDKSLKEVIVKQWGYPYQPQRTIGTLDAAVLAARADKDLALGVVPAWVRCIIGAVDVQGNRFEFLARGFGVQRESIVLEHKVIKADPGASVSDWDDLFAMLIAKEYPLAARAGWVMKLRGIGIDAYGQPGVTPHAFSAWRRWKLKREIRLVGNFSGREAHTIMLLQGGTAVNGNPFVVTRPDTDKQGRRTGARGDVPRGLFNPNYFKDQLQTQLTTGLPGPGYVHFPGGLKAAQEPHPFFEQLVAETRNNISGRWKKKTDNARNETWDLMVMTGAIMHLFAPSRFDWERPPTWAQAQETNSLVQPASTEKASPRVLPGAVGPTPAAVIPARAPAPLAGQAMTVAQRMAARRLARQAAPAASA